MDFPSLLFSAIVKQIAEIHAMDVPVTEKGVYELVSQMDWFHIGFDEVDRFLGLMKELYPGWTPPNAVMEARRRKEALIAKKKVAYNPPIFFNHARIIGRCKYAWEVNTNIGTKVLSESVTDVSVFTTDTSPVLCNFRISCRKKPYYQNGMSSYQPVIRIRNSDNRRLHICVSVVAVEKYGEATKPYELHTHRHYTFSTNRTKDLILDIEPFATKCEVIFHEIYDSNNVKKISAD
jgi:hypothetical protein